ncbi:MAG: DUF2179 domain-containing protein [Spirochaetes bacterium]|nr:DUF2179 domain-containing protein [Spirochaetota bacterium]HOD14717.1 DUF5698 domain-containing protein [Spirochaetota bacterium]
MQVMNIDIAGVLIIFGLRLMSVPLGIIRALMVVRGIKHMAAIAGFIEELIWVIAIYQVMSQLDTIANIVAYAGGYGAGVIIGMLIEEKLALGLTAVNIITPADDTALKTAIKESGFGMTMLEASGIDKKQHFLRIITPRRRLNKLLDICSHHACNSFLTVEDIRTARGGYRI